MPITIGVLRRVTPARTRVALTPMSPPSSLEPVRRVLRGARRRRQRPVSRRAVQGRRVRADRRGACSRRQTCCSRFSRRTARGAQRAEAGRRRPRLHAGHAREPELVRALRDAAITSFAMELVPRISRAQSMDALSSQAAVAGYKAVLIARRHARQVLADADDRRRHDPAGAGARHRRRRRGPAGDRDRAAARRDRRGLRRPRRDQGTDQSLGAKFVDTGVSAEGAGGYARELTAEEKAKQQEVLDQHIAAADAVITTAAVPGRAGAADHLAGGGRAHEARAP